MSDDIPTSVDGGAPLLISDPRSTVRIGCNSKGEPVYEIKLRLGDDATEVLDMYHTAITLFKGLQKEFPRTVDFLR